MKKRIFAIAVIVIYLSLAAWHTFAYYNTEKTAHNIITSGGVDIAIEEWRKTEDGLEEYPNEPIGIMPGAQISKIVTVKCLDEPAWLRMKYDYTVISASGDDITESRDILEEMIIIEPNSEDYFYYDGWWYYNKSLDTGDITEPLFTEVSFNAEMLGNKYEGSTLIITVTAGAVQASNNGETVVDAVGWTE